MIHNRTRPPAVAAPDPLLEVRALLASPPPAPYQRIEIVFATVLVVVRPAAGGFATLDVAATAAEARAIARRHPAAIVMFRSLRLGRAGGFLTMTPLDVALDYIGRGWAPVPVPYRKKRRYWWTGRICGSPRRRLHSTSTAFGRTSG